MGPRILLEDDAAAACRDYPAGMRRRLHVADLVAILILGVFVGVFGTGLGVAAAHVRSTSSPERAPLRGILARGRRSVAAARPCAFPRAGALVKLPRPVLDSSDGRSALGSGRRRRGAARAGDRRRDRRHRTRRHRDGSGPAGRRRRRRRRDRSEGP